MAYPVSYTRLFDFANYQNLNPSRPLPGIRVNLDLNDIQRAIGQIIAHLQGITRSDGALANGSVGLDQLSSGVIAGIEEPTLWESGVDYTVHSTVFYGAILYRANVDHTAAATFDASKWDELADLTSVFDSFSEKLGKTPEDYGAAGDTIRLASSSVTVSGTAATIVGASFTAADVGKVIVIQGAGTAGAYHTTTIDAVGGATTITLHAGAPTSLTAVAKEVIYGTNDTEAWADIEADINAGNVKSFAHTLGAKYLVLPTLSGFTNLLTLDSSASGLTYDARNAELIIAVSSQAIGSAFLDLTALVNFKLLNFLGTAVQGAGGNWWVLAHGANRNITVEGDFTGGNAGVDFARSYDAGDTAFSRNVTITGRFKGVYYPVLNRSNILGHYVYIDCEDCGRELTTYGNEGPTEFFIRSKNSFAQTSLGAYGHNTDTALKKLANVKGTYVNTESTTGFGQIYIFHQQADPSVDSIATVIENLDIKLDITYPAIATNGFVAYNDSQTGHSGTSTPGNCAHIERNIRFSGSVRGRNANAPLFSISTAANGWGALGDTHWIIEDLEIPNETTNTIAIGRYAKTTFRGIKAPNLVKPTLEASGSFFNHQWVDCVFADAGTTWATRPFNTPMRIYPIFGADPQGILFDANARADFADGVAVGGSVYADAGNFYIRAHDSRVLQFNTSSVPRWYMDIAAGNLIPNSSNTTDLGDATHHVKDYYGRTIKLYGSASGNALIVAQAAAGTPTLTLPNASGTFAVSATSPLALSATTGALTISGSALTRVDDTNVTLTLGGTPTTALLAATTLTLGWTGQLSVARGGSGAATLTGFVLGNGTSAFTALAVGTDKLIGTNGSTPSLISLPATGLQVSGGNLSLANDLSALEGLASTGIARRTGTDAWSVGTTVAVGEGGTGITSGTSGGIPYFSSTSTIASSAALTANAIVKGGGAGAAPVASGISIDGSNNITGAGTFNGVTIDNNAWSTYTPTVTSSAGSITTVSSTGRYKIFGKTCVIFVTYNITSLGTATGDINLTFPPGITPQGSNIAGNGIIISTDGACVVKVSTIPSLQFVAGATAQQRGATFVIEAT